MNSVNPIRYALSVCVIAMLTACVGSQGLIGQSAAGLATAGIPATVLLTNENMYSSRVTAGQCVHHGSDTKIAFRAHGRARGAYPGSFKTHGTISAVANGSNSTTWNFSEKFMISSGSQTLSGTIEGGGTHSFEWSPCASFKNDNMKFTMGNTKGRASVHIIYGAKEHFWEQLSGV